jgi:hypothetical protein
MSEAQWAARYQRQAADDVAGRQLLCDALQREMGLFQVHLPD